MRAFLFFELIPSQNGTRQLRISTQRYLLHLDLLLKVFIFLLVLLRFVHLLQLNIVLLWRVIDAAWILNGTCHAVIL